VSDGDLALTLSRQSQRWPGRFASSSVRRNMRTKSVSRKRGWERCVISAIVALATAVAQPVPAQTVQQVSPAGLAAILAEPLTPGQGAPDGDVTVIEYLDYNCPVCRRTDVEIEKLLAGDARIRVVYKDWPIAASAYAAYCVFAAALQGKYQAAHHALIRSRRKLDSLVAIREVLRETGIDTDRLETDIERHRREFSATLTRNHTEATALHLKGTPALIIGDRLVAGGLDAAQLRLLVADVRMGESSDPMRKSCLDFTRRNVGAIRTDHHYDASAAGLRADATVNTSPLSPKTTGDESYHPR
jgi:protein-disulfide isomerase